MSAIRSMQVERPVAVGDAADGTGVGAPAPKGGATPGDLSELMASFNEVTARLEATHGVLRGEVARLTEELRQANERLRRSERLAELGEMAAGIAHEIRNPLGSISLYSEMLAQDLAGDDESAQTARKIGSSVRRLDAIVRDVLDFARDLRVRPEAVETEDLIEAAAGSPRFGDASGDPSGVSIRVRIEPGAAVVRCDRSLGMQALLNVIENARQANAAAGETGPVEVTASPCRVRTGGGASVEGVSLAVRDRGPGIDESVLGRMFNPFFTTRETGTGLGLAIVHRIVDAHGGEVVVRNNAELDGGAGATVGLRFPLGEIGEAQGSQGSHCTEQQA